MRMEKRMGAKNSDALFFGTGGSKQRIPASAFPLYPQIAAFYFAFSENSVVTRSA